MTKYLTACAALYLSLTAAAFGCELEVTDPWIREAPPTATALAGYMVLANPGSEDCVVTGVRAKGFGGAMLHRTEQKDGMAHMMHQNEVTVPAGGSVIFEPNGLHIMLMKPQQALERGDRVAVTLVLEDGSENEIAFPVRGAR
jgi:copper(I)-binding protein